MLQHSGFVGIAFASVVVASGCASGSTTSQPSQEAQLARAVAAPDRAGPPQPLSPAAREILKSRMASHARDMSDLVSAIMILDYDRITGRGEAIAIFNQQLGDTRRDIVRRLHRIFHFVGCQLQR